MHPKAEESYCMFFHAIVTTLFSCRTDPEFSEILDNMGGIGLLVPSLLWFGGSRLLIPGENWTGRRGSNPQPTAWEAATTIELLPL
jgi:hypothetical protein